jgi:hypothetical protein
MFALGTRVQFSANSAALLALAIPLTCDAASSSFAPYAAAGVTRTDNIGREAVSPRDETLGTVTAGARYRRQTDRTDLDLTGELLTFNYFQNTVQNEVRPRLEAAYSADLLPENLRWAVEDRYGQIAARAYREISPNSRENNNYFSTGPEFQAELGRAIVAGASARYAVSSYEISPADNARKIGSAYLSYELSDRQSAGLYYYISDVSFDSPLAPKEFTLSALSVGYQASLRSVAAKLQAGVSRSRVEERSGTEPLLIVEATLTPGRYSTIGVTYYRGYQDASNAFRADAINVGAGGQIDENMLAVADTYLADESSLFWSMARRRLSMRIAAKRTSEDYRTLITLDRVRYSVGVDASYILGSRSQAGVYASDERENGRDGQPLIRFRSIGVEMAYGLGAKLALSAAAERFRLSEPTGVSVENRFSVELRYSPNPSGSPAGYDRSLRRRWNPLPGAASPVNRDADQGRVQR